MIQHDSAPLSAMNWVKRNHMEENGKKQRN